MSPELIFRLLISRIARSPIVELVLNNLKFLDRESTLLRVAVLVEQVFSFQITNSAKTTSVL